LSKPPRDQSTSPSCTYFLTTNADGNKALFQSERLAKLLIATMLSCRDQKKYFLHEFVVMPNHLHLLLTTSEDTTLERAVQLIKDGFSFRAKREFRIASEIWQRGYVDHRVRDASD
jgi:putative transposase